jgi:diguanylate cyclase (GGDEF)-like protein
MSKCLTLLKGTQLMVAALLFLVMALVHAEPMPDSASSPVPFSFDLSQQSWSLNHNVQYYPASDREEIYRMVHMKSGWKTFKKGIFNLGLTDEAYWLKVDMVYSGGGFQEWWLEIAEPSLQHLDVYSVVDSQVGEFWPGGNRMPFNQRKMNRRNFIYPLNFFSDENVTIYIYVKTDNSLQVPINLWQQGDYLGHTGSVDLVLGFFFGALLLMALYNFFIYVTLKDKSYLYYVTFVLSMVLYQASIQGIMYEFVWYNYPAIQRVSIGLSLGLFVFFAGHFVYEFLDLKARKHFLFTSLKNTSWLGLVLTIPTAIFYNEMLVWMVLTAGFAWLLAIIVAVYRYIGGYQPAKILLIAWVCMLISSGVTGFSKLGFISRNSYTDHADIVGVIIIVLLMSLGLAYRIGEINSRRFSAQRRLLNEVREREMAEKKLLHQTLHDSITDLPNIKLLEYKYSSNIESLNHEQGMALMLISLQGFQEISNTLGHENGDVLLSMSAKRLVGALNDLGVLDKQKENIAHVSGVTFIVLLKSQRPLHDAEQISRQLIHLMSSPFILEEMSIDVGCCIGISLYAEHGEDLDELRRNAQIALEVAQKGGDHFTIYADSINPYSERRLIVMGHLRQALVENQLEIFYQPQLHLATQKISSVEALVRWDHPQLGQISPAEFVPLVEQTGLMREFTQWVLDESLMHLAALRQKHEELQVSVNFSAKNLLEADLATRLMESLQRVNLPSSALKIEVTETAMMSDPERALNVLRLINHLGIGIAIDDFGTGYSSLSYLRRLPVQELKIDGSFVFNMCSEKDDETVVKAAINLGHDMGIEVVAEGIEDQETLERLNELGCDKIQGYHLAKPMPLDQFKEWLESYKP